MVFTNPNSGNGIFFRNDKDGHFGEIVEQSDKRPFYQENNVISGVQSPEQVSDKRVRLSTEINLQDPPLGLKLDITPSFIKLVEEMELSQTRKSADQEVDCKKLKASNFPATLLKIDNWERLSRREGDVMAKFYYANKKIAWEILDGPLKSKIELEWSTIIGIKAEKESGILKIELDRPPLFFQEKSPTKGKQTMWRKSKDFTGATNYRRHYLVFPPKVLDGPYEMLLRCDKRLYELSKKPPLVIVDSPSPMSGWAIEKQTTMFWSTKGVSNNNQGQSSMTMATQGSQGFPHQDFPPMNPVESSGTITPFWNIEKHLFGDSEVECPDAGEFLELVNSMFSVPNQEELNFNNNNNIIANDLGSGNENFGTSYFVSNTNEYSGVNDGLVSLPPQNSNVTNMMMNNPQTNQPWSPYAFSEPTVDDFAVLGSSQNIRPWG